MDHQLILLFIVLAGLSVFGVNPAAGQNPATTSHAPAKVEPTRRHYPYGSDPLQYFNFWKAPSDKPTPVLVRIHGGGWHDAGPDETFERTLLDRGISVASIEYRLLPNVNVPVPLLDAARAIQTLRSKAEEWGLDRRRFFYEGTSAGACTSLWLAMHDDLADPASADPVARESTKPVGVLAHSAQTCIDPMVLREWTGNDVILRHRMILHALGHATVEQVLADYEKNRAIYREYSAINHVDSSDPPVYLQVRSDMSLPPRETGHAIHHPIHSLKLKEKLDAAGVQCLLDGVGEKPKLSPTAFMLEKLTGSAAR